MTLWEHISETAAALGLDQRALENRLGRDGKFVVFWLKAMRHNEQSNTISRSVSRRLGDILGASPMHVRDFHLTLRGVPKRQAELFEEMEVAQDASFVTEEKRTNCDRRRNDNHGD